MLRGWPAALSAKPDAGPNAGRAALEAAREAGHLDAIDLAFARLMLDFDGGRAGDALALAAALTSVRVRAGDVCLELAACAGDQLSQALDAAQALDAPSRPDADMRLPDLASWRQALRASPAVGAPGCPQPRPLVLDAADRLYLQRHWSDESMVAERLLALATPVSPPVDAAATSSVVNALFRPEEPLGRQAASATLNHRLCIVTGGPGTGKTTLAARLIALLIGAGLAHPGRIGLAAPTGKAATRLQEAVAGQMQALAQRVPEAAAFRADASTIHRLLFRARGTPLKLDALILDEASMVDVSLMAMLLATLPQEARLIILGDARQLASVQPGAVLGDICGAGRADDSPLRPALIELVRSHRFDVRGGIGQLAAAIVGGEPDAALAALADPRSPETELGALTSVVAFDRLAAQYAAEACEACVRGVREHGAASPPFPPLRVLCAHRRGPYGAERFNRLVERHLRNSGAAGGGDVFYPGRPIIVTRNDPASGLSNGDVGVALRSDGGVRVWFPELSTETRRFEVAPSRLPEHETFFALTVHRAQGSEYPEVAFIPGPAESRVATRELFYTAVTRAQRKVVVHGDADGVRTAIGRTAERATGLAVRLRQ